MTGEDYWKVAIQQTLQHHDDDGYTDSEENCTCPVSWFGLIHVNSKNIKGSYPQISAETLFSLFFL